MDFVQFLKCSDMRFSVLATCPSLRWVGAKVCCEFSAHITFSIMQLSAQLKVALGWQCVSDLSAQTPAVTSPHPASARGTSQTNLRLLGTRPLVLGTWNLRGLTRPEKQQEVGSYMEAHETDILAVQESWEKPSHTVEDLQANGLHWLWSVSHSQQKRRGRRRFYVSHTL